MGEKLDEGAFDFDIAAVVAVPSLAIAQGMPMQGPGMMGSPAATPAAKGFMDSMQRMTKSMRMQPSGDADKDFAAMMIGHHQGAIDMAKVELQYGKDPILREMAQNIIKAQEGEIATLKKWQAEKAK